MVRGVRGSVLFSAVEDMIFGEEDLIDNNNAERLISWAWCLACD